jgi:hypothetical protein
LSFARPERGYQVTLVADAHTTGDTPVLNAKDIIAHHNQTLAGLFAVVGPAASVTFGEEAGHECPDKPMVSR